MRLYIYYAMFPLGLILSMIPAVKCGKRYGIEKKNAVLFNLTGFISGVLGAMLISYPYNMFLDRAFGEGLHSVSRFSLFGALLFMPLLLIIPARLMNMPYTYMTDICSPGVYLVLTLGKIGCFIYGCCGGIPMNGGHINPLTGQAEFPVQLLEAAFTLLLFIFGMMLISKGKAKGIIYPLLLALYTAGRFLAEFLRGAYITEKTVTGFADFWQIVSVIGFISALSVIFFLKIRKGKLQKSV